MLGKNRGTIEGVLSRDLQHRSRRARGANLGFLYLDGHVRVCHGSQEFRTP